MKTGCASFAIADATFNVWSSPKSFIPCGSLSFARVKEKNQAAGMAADPSGSPTARSGAAESRMASPPAALQEVTARRRREMRVGPGVCSRRATSEP